MSFWLQEKFKEKLSKQLDKTELNANRLRNRYTVCRATKNCKFKLHFSLETLMDETATAAKKNTVRNNLWMKIIAVLKALLVAFWWFTRLFSRAQLARCHEGKKECLSLMKMILWWLINQHISRSYVQTRENVCTVFMLREAFLRIKRE